MIRKLIAQDRNIITYRPALREIGGSITGTILLQQIIYWDDKCGGKFFKFSEPCDHSMYRPGDSWSEELGMSAKELRTALNKFAFKCGAKNKELYGADYEKMRDKAVVQYYTDSSRVTWYILNREVIGNLLSVIYKEDDESEVILSTETTQETNTDIIANAHLCVQSQKAEGGTLKGSRPRYSDRFESLWKAYGMKGTKTIASRRWEKLPEADKQAIEKAAGPYVASTPDKMYRKNLEGWINPANRIWENAIEMPKKQERIGKDGMSLDIR